MEQFTSFLFPLPILAMGKSWRERFNILTSYCLVEVGSRLVAENDEDEIATVMASFDEKSLPSGYSDLDSSEKRIWCLGAKAHSIVRGSARGAFHDHKKVTEFIESISKGISQPSKVKIAASWLWDWSRGKGVSERDLSVICGINSIVGDKDYKLVTRHRLRAAALGYWRKDMLFDDAGSIHENGRRLLESRQDAAKPLETHQLRFTLQKLDGVAFSRVAQTKTRILFSTKFNKEQLLEKLCEDQKRRNENAFSPRIAALEDQYRKLQQAGRQTARA